GARQGLPDLFRRHQVDPRQVAESARRIGGWAIRESVLAGLDLWLFVDNKRPGLCKLLAALDGDPDRTAWRAAVAAGDHARKQEAAARLVGRRHPPLFLAAYVSSFPREVAET